MSSLLMRTLARRSEAKGVAVRTSSVKAIAALCLGVSALLTNAPAQAQDLFLTSGSYTANDAAYQQIYAGANASLGTIDPNTGQPYVATLNVVNGANITRIRGYNTSTVNISGGSVTDIFSLGNSVFNITGGTIGQNTIRLFENSILNVFGTGLAFSSTGRGSDGNGSYTGYSLSGTLQSGQNLGNVSFFDYDGGSSVGDPNAGTGNLRFFAAAAAPEPTSLALLGLVGIPFVAGVARRRK